MRLSNNCRVLLHISHRLSIFKTDDLTALPLLAFVVCLLACKLFIISPTIWRMYVYVQDAHKHSASLYCFFFVLAVGYDDEIGSLVKIFGDQIGALLRMWRQWWQHYRRRYGDADTGRVLPIQCCGLSSPAQRASALTERIDFNKLSISWRGRRFRHHSQQQEQRRSNIS